MTGSQEPLVIRNLSQIVTVDNANPGELGVIEKGAIVCDEKIRWLGPEAELTSVDVSPGNVIDGKGGIATPGLVDSHTHLLYAGSREDEFIQRVSGATFGELAASGGGILSTVKATREAKEDELVRLGLHRLDSFLRHGITTVEVKSGYGLTTAEEIKMLEVMRLLNQQHEIDVVSTFMGAHALPPEYSGRSSEYVNLLIKEMIPQVASGDLAEFCDVFCDDLAFSVDESEAILTAASDFGLGLKVHAEQFSASGGTAAAVRLNACSVDHLDYVTDTLIEDLAASDVVAVLTPGVNFFLGQTQWPPARKLIDAGIKVAISTDYSPGACMSESLPLVMTIAVLRLQMHPEEVLKGATRFGALAVGREATVGSLAVGKLADIVIWAAPTYQHIVYHFGVNHVMTIIKNGRVVVEAMTDGCLVH